MDLDKIFKGTKSSAGIVSCEIYVDAEGDWYHQGNRITREDILELFYQNLHLTTDGKYLIEWQQNRCLLEVEDTPLVVAAVDRPNSGDAENDQIFLRFRHLPDSEALVPTTLWVGKDNILYCHCRQGQFPARFSRPAYYQLAQWITEDTGSGEFYIAIGNKKYFISTSEVSS